MTVRELIEKLGEYDDGAIILVTDREHGDEMAVSVEYGAFTPGIRIFEARPVDNLQQELRAVLISKWPTPQGGCCDKA